MPSPGSQKRKQKQKPSVLSETTCSYCLKTIDDEEDIASHTCKVKERFLLKGERDVSFAFKIFQDYFAYNHRQHAQKTFDDFIRSRYYEDMLKFARHVLDLKIGHPLKFADFVIKSGLPLRRWTSDYVYETFTREMTKKETADAALERSLLLMEQWANDTGNDWRDFFRKIPPVLAVFWIKSGRISPWILYTAETGTVLLERMTEEQLAMIAEVIDPEFWEKKLTDHVEDVNFIRSTLRAEGV